MSLLKVKETGPPERVDWTWRVEAGGRENRTPGLRLSPQVVSAAAVGAAAEAKGSSGQVRKDVQLEAQVWAISLPGL